MTKTSNKNKGKKMAHRRASKVANRRAMHDDTFLFEKMLQQDVHDLGLDPLSSQLTQKIDELLPTGMTLRRCVFGTVSYHMELLEKVQSNPGDLDFDSLPPYLQDLLQRGNEQEAMAPKKKISKCCFNCGEEGHHVRDCPEPKDRDVVNQCYNNLREAKRKRRRRRRGGRGGRRGDAMQES